MDSKLPSLSIYWIKYHDIGIRAISESNYTGAIASILSMNALLTDEYRLEVDSNKHRQITKTHLKGMCGHCEAENERECMKIYNLLLPMFESLCRNKKTIRVWNCIKCGQINELENTKFKKLENSSPFYYKVIPEPPQRSAGIEGRTKYHNKIMYWFYSALEELDHQLGLYRAEYEAVENRDDVIDLEGDYV